MLYPIVMLALVVFAIAGFWKVYTKAGEPGWAVLVPIYNVVVLLRIAGRPWWWLLLCFIPILNLIILIVISMDVARNFGKSPLFGIGLSLLGFIFYPILGFGGAEYQAG